MSNSTPRRRQGGGGATQRGLFTDGVWHCDCSPRQPANHFEVKKQGPNHGKWFRTCQKQQNDKSRCKFFLWDSDAHPREAAALANNTRTEPSHAVPKTPSKHTASPPPPYTIEPRRGDSSRKRTRATSLDLDDEYDFGAAGSESFEDELNHCMVAHETPRKAPRTNSLVTPSSRRILPWNKEYQGAVDASELQTPQTNRSVQAGSLSSKLGRPLVTPTRPIGEARLAAMSSPSPCETPTPSRFKDVVGEDLVLEVFDMLQDDNVNLPATIEICVRNLLSKHAKTAEGLRRGRDVTRTTIKARDTKIAELTYRISTLEAELETEKAMVKHLQWNIQTSNQSSS